MTGSAYERVMEILRRNIEEGLRSPPEDGTADIFEERETFHTRLTTAPGLNEILGEEFPRRTFTEFVRVFDPGMPFFNMLVLSGKLPPRKCFKCGHVIMPTICFREFTRIKAMDVGEFERIWMDERVQFLCCECYGWESMRMVMEEKE